MKEPCFLVEKIFSASKSRVLIILSLFFFLSGCFSTVQYYKRSEQFVGHEFETGFNRFLQCDGVNKEKNYCKDYPPKNRIAGEGPDIIKVDNVEMVGAKEIAPTIEALPWAAQEETLPPLPPMMLKPLPEDVKPPEKKVEVAPKKDKKKSKKSSSKKKAKKKTAAKPAKVKKEEKKAESPKENKTEAPASENKEAAPVTEVNPNAPQQLVPSSKEIEATP